MRDGLLIAISSVLTITSVVPYILDIIRGKTKPRVVSWFTWCLLTAIAAAATFADKQYATSVLLFCGTIGTLLVVVPGWRHGDKKFSKMDIVCQLGALLGLVVWWTLDSPAWAVVTTMVVDFVGSIPTLVHSWLQPYEETWITYLFSAVAGLFTLFAVEEWKITSVLPAAYLLIINAVFTAVIILRHPYAVKGKPPTLLEV